MTYKDLSEKAKEHHKAYNKIWDAKNIDKCRAYRKKWRINNLKKHAEIQKRYRLNNPDRIKAQEIARYYVKMDDHCGICKSTENLEKHHWRYDQPKLIATLCRECHGIQHQRGKQ